MFDLKKSHLFARSIGLIRFDTLISEQHQSTLTITDYPVESGAPITDHSYKENDTLTLVIGHSVQPFKTDNQVGDDLDPATRLSFLYDQLVQAQNIAELFEVGTGIKLYDSMVIQSLATVRDKLNTSIMTVTVVMREVVIVDINEIDKFIERYSTAGGIQDRASSEVNRGNVSTEDITGTAEERATSQSLLDRGFSGLSNLLN